MTEPRIAHVVPVSGYRVVCEVCPNTGPLREDGEMAIGDAVAHNNIVHPEPTDSEVNRGQ